MSAVIEKLWRKDIKNNKYLDEHDRKNLKILSRVPHLSKWVHNRIMFLKGIRVEE